MSRGEITKRQAEILEEIAAGGGVRVRLTGGAMRSASQLWAHGLVEFAGYAGSLAGAYYHITDAGRAFLAARTEARE